MKQTFPVHLASTECTVSNYEMTTGSRKGCRSRPRTAAILLNKCIQMGALHNGGILHNG